MQQHRKKKTESMRRRRRRKATLSPADPGRKEHVALHALAGAHECVLLASSSALGAPKVGEWMETERGGRGMGRPKRGKDAGSRGRERATDGRKRGKKPV